MCNEPEKFQLYQLIAVELICFLFYKARCEAAKHNEPLSSREGAADMMSIDRGRLYRIESGIANPYPEEIHLMSDLYNAPELENYYFMLLTKTPLCQLRTPGKRTWPLWFPWHLPHLNPL